MAQSNLSESPTKSGKLSALESVSSVSKVIKDVIAASRDAVLLVIGLLLLVAPTSVGRMLTQAGFTKGNVLGFEWAGRAQEASAEVTSVQAALHDLTEQYETLKAAYGEAVKQA